MTRIAITGGPRTGKTTLARDMAGVQGLHEGLCRDLGVPRVGPSATPPVRRTDDLIDPLAHLGKDAWSEASRIASTWLDERGPWIIEGVAVSRALRKWHEANPGEPPPVDRVIFLAEPFEPMTRGQEAMAKGCATVHRQIEGWLAEHGIRTEFLVLRDLQCEHQGNDGTAKLE